LTTAEVIGQLQKDLDAAKADAGYAELQQQARHWVLTHHIQEKNELKAVNEQQAQEIENPKDQLASA
jgi:hypothetical protein